MNALTEVFGSRTKVHIIHTLASIHEPMTRNAVSKTIGTSTSRVYEQMDQLRTLGVLKQNNDLYTLNNGFPFYDLIIEIALTMDGYYDDPTTLLSQIDRLHGDEYYLSGFGMATAYITPIDYDILSFQILTLHDDDLSILDRASIYRITTNQVNEIPPDVSRHRIYNTTVWGASLERAIIDCLISDECSTYGSYLILCQYIREEGPDLDRLIEIAHIMGKLDLIGTLLHHIDGTSIKRPYQKVEISKIDLGNALNTIGGG